METITYREHPQNIGKKRDVVQKAWQFTYNRLKVINKLLTENIKNEDVSIAVAGSYGRYEASEESDLDFFVLCDNKDLFNEVFPHIEAISKEYNIPLPKKGGVFSEPISLNDLTEKMCNPEENIRTMAQRMLLLLETRPIYNKQKFDAVVSRILEKYLEYIIKEPERETVFLLNDTIRYFRSICVSYQYDFWYENDKWPLRNIKLRHSRVVMYAGLLFSIMNASKNQTNKYEYIDSMLELTPLERIVNVYENNNKSPDKILDIYTYFLDQIGKKEVRKSLQVSYEDRYSNDTYKKMKGNSDILQKELTDFIFSQKNIWSDRIFEYLMF